MHNNLCHVRLKQEIEDKLYDLISYLDLNGDESTEELYAAIDNATKNYVGMSFNQARLNIKANTMRLGTKTYAIRVVENGLIDRWDEKEREWIYCEVASNAYCKMILDKIAIEF